MKIEVVRIRNLASLAGTQPELRFGSGGMESGLVAITGPTGAGKSTILDAICLALFGDTPRLTGKGEEANAGNILSRGTHDGYAEVEFVDARGRRLRARWEITRSRNDVLQAPKMSLLDLDTETEIAGKKTEATAAVEDALRLDRDQFLGVVLLAQGSFSAFLSGREDERGLLLERLTGSEIYTQLGKAAFAWMRRCEREVKELAQRADEHRVLPDEELRALEAELVVRTERSREAEASAREARQHEERLLAWQKALEAEAAARTELDERIRSWEAAEEQRAELRDAERLAPLRVVLSRCDDRRADVQELRAELARAKEDGKSARERFESDLEEEKSSLERALGGLQFARAGQRSLGRFASADPSCITRLDGLRRTHVQAQEQAAKRAAQSLGIRERLELLDRRLEAGRARRDEAGRISADARAALEVAERDLEDAKSSEGDETERKLRLQDWNGLRDWAVAREQWRKQCAREVEQREKTRAALAEAKETRARAEGRQAACKEARALAEKRWERVRSEVEIAAFRDELRPGEPCPLCEQVVDRVPAAIRDERLQNAKAEFDRCRETEQSATEHHRDCEDEVSQLDARLLASERSLELASTQGADSATGYARIRERLPALPEDPDACDEPFVRSGIERAKASCLRLEELQKRFEGALTKHEDLRRQEGEKKEELQELEKELAGLRAEGRAAESEARSAAEASAAAEREFVSELTALATELGAEAPGLPEAESWLAWCRQEHARLLRFNELVRELGPALEEHESELLGLLPVGTQLHVVQADVGENSELRAAFDTAQSVRRGRAQSGQSARDAKAHVVALEKRLRQAEDRSAAQERELQDALRKVEEEEEARVRAGLRTPERMQELRVALQVLEKERSGAETRLRTRTRDQEEARKALGIEASAAVDELPALLGRARERSQQAETARADAAEALALCKQGIAADQKSRARLRELSEDATAARTRFEEASALHSLIGDATGKKFRAIAQELTLDALVHFANRRLGQFAPRYRLRRGYGLRLSVLDRDLADELRPVTTLSGGESFLVSLSLAIALSDLRRGHADIRSVFIDEGFGSLDQQSLEVALAALENVQSQLGAQLVVISHVGDLQNRWPDRIEVRRAARGRSWLRVPGGATSPPRDAEPAVRGREALFDMDAIVELLAQRPEGLTRARIAKELGLVNDAKLTRALKGEARIVAEYKTYRVVGE